MSNPLAVAFAMEKRWTNYRLETIEGRITKVPYYSAKKKASSTNPSTWKTYDEAKAGLLNVANKFSGIGIVFLPDQLVLGIDIDHCLERLGIDKYQLMHEDAEKIRDLLIAADTYTEISPSKTGLHLYFKLTEPFEPTANKSAPFELYTKGRYFTVTEMPFGKTKEVRTITPVEAEKILATIGYPWNKPEALELQSAPSSPQEGGDQALIDKMFSAKNGIKMKNLYDGDTSEHGNDLSRADLALCSSLAFWTRKDASRIERIWLASPLGSRNKTQDRKDYRDRTIKKAIVNCKEVYTSQSVKKEKEEKPRESQADRMLKMVLERKDITLFQDEHKDGYVSIDQNGQREVWPCKSKSTRDWLSQLAWETEERSLGSEVLKSIISSLEAKARFGGLQYKLNNRVAWHDGELWYDLIDKDCRAVKINKNGWSIENKIPILFKRYPHHQPQLLPQEKGDLGLFLKYINVTDNEHKLLLLVFLVSCFIPGFPHAMLVIFGAQGSSKSTLAKLLRMLIDPSIIETAGLPSNLKELVQILAHHHFIFFDNISYIPDDVSDLLAKAVSGTGFAKRVLYENDEDMIYRIQRCIGINGINLVTTRPDLLERSVLVELQRVETKNRKPESEVFEGFKNDLPSILGGVFDTLARAIKIKPGIKLDSKPRMADFAVWGCAISEAMGNPKEDFLKAYQNNINRQSEMLLNDNVLATAIISFMADKEEWRDTPTSLLTALNGRAQLLEINTWEKYWPKSSSALSRRLNELSTNLKHMGILVTISTSGSQRSIHIQKTGLQSLP